MANSNVPALIIQKNYEVNLDNGTPGLAGTVPTIGAGAVIDGDYWAVPVTGGGVVTGFNYEATTPGSTDAPDPQAFHVVRISQNNASDFWYIAGTSDEYLGDQNAAECCDDAHVRELPSSEDLIFGCQILCTTDANGDYVGVLGAPTIPLGGYKFVANGLFNGSALIQLNAATTTALLTQLNSNWGAVGTWTKQEASPADGIATFVVTQSAGSGEDVLCAQIRAVPL